MSRHILGEIWTPVENWERSWPLLYMELVLAGFHGLQDFQVKIFLIVRNTQKKKKRKKKNKPVGGRRGIKTPCHLNGESRDMRPDDIAVIMPASGPHIMMLISSKRRRINLATTLGGKHLKIIY